MLFSTLRRRRPLRRLGAGRSPSYPASPPVAARCQPV